MANENTVPDLEALAREILTDAVTYAEVTGINFFKNSFNIQGWQGNTFEAWPARKSGEDGRGILLKTSHLRDSIRILESSPVRIVYGTSSPYAQIHNEGGTIQVRMTEKSRKFFWFMFKATGNVKWKYMAFGKIGKVFNIKMPKRQFIGESPAYLAQLDAWITEQINQRFEKAT